MSRGPLGRETRHSLAVNTPNFPLSRIFHGCRITLIEMCRWRLRRDLTGIAILRVRARPFFFPQSPIYVVNVTSLSMLLIVSTLPRDSASIYLYCIRSLKRSIKQRLFNVCILYDRDASMSSSRNFVRWENSAGKKNGGARIRSEDPRRSRGTAPSLASAEVKQRSNELTHTLPGRNLMPQRKVYGELRRWPPVVVGRKSSRPG